MIRGKKREALKAQIIEIESNAKNSVKFYHKIKNQTLSFQPRLRLNICKDVNGNLLEEDKIMERWQEYFHQLLNAQEEERER